MIGAGGGVGASTLAAVLAWAAGGVLIDLDPVGGGIDVLLGIETTPGARWSGLHLAGGRLEPSLLAGGLPRWRRTRVLAADRSPPPEAIGPVCAAAAEVGVVVLDVPRLPCPVREAALDVADLVLLLGRCTVPSLAGVRAVLGSLGADGATGTAVGAVGVVLRRGEVPLDEARAGLAAPPVAVLPASCRVALATRPPPRPLATAAAGILDGLAGKGGDGPGDGFGDGFRDDVDEQVGA